MKGAWSLDLPTVASVIDDAVKDNEDLGKALKKEDIEAMAGDFAASKASFTGGAIGAWEWILDDEFTRINGIVRRIEAGIFGVADATAAYCEGQLDMADNFNREMVNSAQTGNFDYFNEHGKFKPNGGK